ncbi:WXG100 family type VII secretion target [Streptomyces sp. NRRL S-350]|uniref:WXG100 family type VII secretion target n=1 Tax=Streptomyces sp. NRRL S-350 TaxID=1463902 RepID=UPI00068CD4EC|nr:WXG100 family type VII secretion target [Streptomyces sp. NRRL S-350]
MADDAAKAGGPSFKIRPGDLKAAAPTFETQSKALKEALDTLKRSLAAAGSPWGGDKQGNEFAQAYNGPHDKVLAGLDVLVTGLSSIADGLDAHADNHTGADNQARKDLTA